MYGPQNKCTFRLKLRKRCVEKKQISKVSLHMKPVGTFTEFDNLKQGLKIMKWILFHEV